jgi:hypothetical protein
MNSVKRELKLEKKIYEIKQRKVKEEAQKSVEISRAISDRAVAKENGITLEELLCQKA